ncbi:MAG TPA: type IV toxin-antitoxin system AbiEi family antitoxin [Acidobacteriaceae bacterium]|nr:type IV toxin-antitoxin system AbiEi family antitoxin [Acidobacteriaceae bacterium]
MAANPQYEPQLSQLRSLDFVRSAKIVAFPSGPDSGGDAELTLQTPEGNFRFLVEQKTSYLDRTFLNMLAAQAKGSEPVLLFARYIPRESAETLMKAGINFVDAAGNIHIRLGNRYERTLVGRRETSKAQDKQRILSPGRIQALFAFAAYPDAAGWTVRQLATAAGISKSAAAQARRQWIADGLLVKGTDGYRRRDPQSPSLHEQLLSGYEQVLRPRLVTGRYRAPVSTPDEVIEHLHRELPPVRWSLTGGPASFRLNRFYQGLEVPLFFEHLTSEVSRKARLLPDREGAIAILKSFGNLPFWKEMNGIHLAHPWLIYCELMRSSDPRAHEAAEELRSEYLPHG